MGKNIEKSPLKQPKTTISKVKKRNPYKKSPIYYIMDKICCEIIERFKLDPLHKFKIRKEYRQKLNMEGPTLKRKLDAYKKNETTQPKTKSGRYSIYREYDEQILSKLQNEQNVEDVTVRKIALQTIKNETFKAQTGYIKRFRKDNHERLIMIKIDQENKKSLNTNAEDELFFLLLLEQGLEENQQYSREYSPINIANNFSYLLTTEEFINDEENNLDLLEEKKFWSEFGKLNYCDNLKNHNNWFLIIVI